MPSSRQPAPAHSAIGAVGTEQFHPSAGSCLIRRQRKVRADWKELERFLRQLSEELARTAYSVCVISDRVMHRYNRDFRGHDETTDVLSFPTGPAGKNQNGYLGDILISAETAESQARRMGIRVEDEMKALALHGVLHLLGYDHEVDGGQMAREIFLASLALVLFSYVNRLYAERSRSLIRGSRDNVIYFERNIEPRLRISADQAEWAFPLLVQINLVLLGLLVAARGYGLPFRWETVLERAVILLVDVVLFAQVVPYALLTRTEGRWLQPWTGFLRAAVLLVSPCWKEPSAS
jgi:probable rRNA maturation factor